MSAANTYNGFNGTPWDQSIMAIAQHTNGIRDLDHRQAVYEGLTATLNGIRQTPVTYVCPEAER
jgi:hypothetical protein